MNTKLVVQHDQPILQEERISRFLGHSKLALLEYAAVNLKLISGTGKELSKLLADRLSIPHPLDCNQG